MGRLLVANRGEIARRILRTAHRMGVQTAAVFSDADRNAMHVREATVALGIGGLTSADSYLRVDKLLDAAKQTGADAIHPGYGFLSENADFAQAVIDAGLTWVGPPPSAIRALGSKSSVKQIAQLQGVPCLPGYWGEDQSDARFALEAQRIGYPVMVKAAAGGGGRGMRLVMHAAQLQDAVSSARTEAQSAFGSGELLLERALLNPRHVEVQVFADSQGNCIHLGERDCSVQRRHQKLIEETPSPAVDAALRERMGQCAVNLAKAAGYVGAGTVEFLLQDGEFFLMEMNTRLQVEHPVTEMVTGLDLVEWQLRVAQGEALPLMQDEVKFSGHSIEVRLCAEDESFVPHSGVVAHFVDGSGLRFDHAIEPGAYVSPYYDSMLGKVIAHAATRAEAVAQLAGALDRIEVLGLATNRQFLAACLRHPQFAAGDATIAFLAGHAAEIRGGLEARERQLALPAGLAALYGAPARDVQLACPFPRPVVLRHRGTTIAARVEAASVDPIRASSVRLPTGAWHVQAAGIDLVVEDASFDPPGGAGAASAGNELRAPFNGKVIAIKAAVGQQVARGDTLLVLESMKLEHALAASRDGIVKSVAVEVGQQAATAQVLVTFEAAA
ncbi:ATP-grasp domain-containing protein [Caenimonas koreensis DSM 17982]|uniref:ATP-grasp domain-containing protein n=1 Tax=Caenimonas koreensis DSM 17982 TaxID=1121255 RepID=A0A844BD39_9BURK|nr:ATP-grasp domain-containing protein [Caenimonas koreensis DSM 17982]